MGVYIISYYEQQFFIILLHFAEQQPQSTGVLQVVSSPANPNFMKIGRGSSNSLQMSSNASSIFSNEAERIYIIRYAGVKCRYF